MTIESMRPRALSLRMGRLALAALGFLMGFSPIGFSAFGLPVAPGDSALVWEPLDLLAARGQSALVLAQQLDSERVALGDDSGVSVWRGGRRDRATLEGVRDLVFDREGTLWIATDDGLYRWQDSERPMRRSLRGGERSNRVLRLSASEEGLLVATAAGAFWSSTGRVFQSLAVGGASISVSLVALESLGTTTAATSDATSDAATLEATARPPVTRLWIFSDERLFMIRGFASASGLRIIERRSVPMPRLSADRGPVDLMIDSPGRRLLLVFEDMVAWRSIETQHDAAAPSEQPGSAGWQIERPVLPPGSVIRRVGWAAGRVWIATDHGLLESESLEGPFVRSASPVGTLGCSDVQIGPATSVLVLCRGEVFVLGKDVRLAAAREWESDLPSRKTDDSGSELPPDPPLEVIREHAIRRAGLSVERSQRLREGLHRRAFWPEMSLAFDADFDRDREWDSDQSFLSGDTRHLFDRSRNDREGFGASIKLEWDLGAIAYPDDAVNLSRELRQVVSLRDDVSDEINQVYFERQGIRERLAKDPALSAAEATRLHLRARELEAGLDAWTGGWVTRWRASSQDPGGIP